MRVTIELEVVLGKARQCRRRLSVVDGGAKPSRPSKGASVRGIRNSLGGCDIDMAGICDPDLANEASSQACH